MTRPRTRILASTVLLAVLATVTGCGGGSAPAEGSKGGATIRYQGWANQVTLPELGADLGYLPGGDLSWGGNTTPGPQDIQAAASGQVDVGGAFDGAVAKLVLSGAPIEAVIA